MPRFRRTVLLALTVIPTALAAQGTRCPPIDSLAPWARVQRAWQAETGQRWTNDSLRRQLLRMREEDQAERRNFGARLGDSAYVRRLMANDSARARTIAGILDAHGLPGRTLVGAAGADAVMLMVQHHSSLQHRVLDLAQRLPPGEISPTALAMLEDRVRAAEGKPQRYATQFTLGPDTLFHLAPTEDLSGLEARRARVGLAPLATYVCFMEEAGTRINRSSLPPS
jgi:hypothetical protein